ncbi:MAG: exodeoxyribonuclease VII large subunit [Verrucomicrobia bacterium]|nr:exodeoxyribonuclease VII large subunit [Verrucomicrobiota bacterium]
MAEERKVYRISELNRLSKTVLEDEVGDVWIEGEISNFRPAPSGHWYFTLKDADAQISAAMFRGNQRGMTFEPKDGMLVSAFGSVTLYEARGNYQIIVRQIEEAGKGSLQEAFEKLKKKLAAEGLFDEARKKPVPLLPQRVGIVTSPTGAAIQDFLNVITRRFPNLHILIVPVKVQGEGSAEEVASALRLLNERADTDVIVITRGGGSLEDLWSFNEEVVARAVAASRIPVISAVGHEIDFTICDFVADLRAPTPSAAAELVIGQKDEFAHDLTQYRRRLGGALSSRLLTAKNRLIGASRSYVFREPRRLVSQYREKVLTLRSDSRDALRDLLRSRGQQLDEAGLRMRHRIEMSFHTRREKHVRLGAQLRALSPVAVLDRGFSITRRADGTILKAATDVDAGEQIETQLAKGRLKSKITHVETEKDDG